MGIDYPRMKYKVYITSPHVSSGGTRVVVVFLPAAFTRLFRRADDHSASRTGRWWSGGAWLGSFLSAVPRTHGGDGFWHQSVPEPFAAMQ